MELNDFQGTSEATKLEEKQKPSYVSQVGFTVSKVYRGFTEIESLYNNVRIYGGLICGGYVRYMCSTGKSVERAGDIDIYIFRVKKLLRASKTS